MKDLKIGLDPKHKLTPSLFFLLEKYTNCEIEFVEQKNNENTGKLPEEDISKILTAFEGTEIVKYLPLIFEIFENEEAQDEIERIIEKYEKESKTLKNLFFSLLYTNGKFNTKLKQELKKKENQNKTVLEFEDLKKGDDLAKKFALLTKPKETCRFPPEPSGFLHLGHVKAVLLNNDLADNLIVRFDNTNQEKSTKEFEDAILEDLSLLELQKYKLTRSSDHHSEILRQCEKLIKSGKAYCDNTDKETMNAQRMDGLESKCRETTVEENLKILKKMIENGTKDVVDESDEYEKYCVRAKISVGDKNKALRDPVICRLKKVKHPLTNSRFSPTYDFACPIIDSLEGITTVLRTNEFRDRNAQYFWLLDTLGLRKPKIKDFSRLNFENTCLSKRKLRGIIEEHNLTWNDPRIPTVKGILRHGLNIDVLKEYIKQQGMKQASSVASWDKIWTMNKKHLDKMCPRYSAIKEANHYKIVFLDTNEKEIEPYENIVEWPLLKRDPNSPKKQVFTYQIAISEDDGDLLENNEEFTLMMLGNCIVLRKDGKTIYCKSNPTGDIKKTKRKISWVSLKDSSVFDLIQYSDLLKNEIFDPNSKQVEKIIVEKACENVQFGESIQFERIAFVIKDKILNSFIVVPQTTQKRER